MKKYILPVFLVTAGLVVAACVPNRLEKSLTTGGPPGQATRPPLAAPTPAGNRSLQPQLGNANIDINEVVTLLPPDAIPAVLPDDVPQILVPAAEADAAGIDPQVRVIGVSINGDNRAYPIPFLSDHEIVNDEIGGRPVAVTW